MNCQRIRVWFYSYNIFLFLWYLLFVKRSLANLHAFKPSIMSSIKTKINEIIHNLADMVWIIDGYSTSNLSRKADKMPTHAYHYHLIGEVSFEILIYVISSYEKIKSIWVHILIIFQWLKQAQSQQKNLIGCHQADGNRYITTTFILATEPVFSLSAEKLFKRLFSGNPRALLVCLLVEKDVSESSKLLPRAER